MKIIAFWEKWQPSHRILYLVFLSVFSVSILYFVFHYFTTPGFVVHWEAETDIETVKTVFDHYRVGLYTFPVLVENYVILQNFLPSEMEIVQWTALTYLVIMSIPLALIMALSTTLRKSWYIISMVLLAVFFVYLKTEFLQIFGEYNKAGIIAAIGLFFPASYFVHFYRNAMPLHQRFFVFLALMGVYGIFLTMFSEAPAPALHIANYGIYPALVVSIIFIFMIGHEPISAFLHVITGSGIRGGKNLLHFFIISLIYLINVLLVYLRNSRDLDLNIYMINSYWLLVFAAVVGIWGYGRRSPTYAGIFPFRPTGALLYLSLGTICFATIAYLLAGAQDSLLETMEDAITFSQLGYGAMFILYVIANFYTMLHNNTNISKIVFKPSRMPYFISKFAGIIVILGLFLRANLVPFYQAISGYHSGLGDIYYHNNDFMAAREYYKLASNYSSSSHRANFALAAIEEKERNSSNALLYYLQSIIKNPTEFAYAKIARIYWLKNRYFDAIFSLREGLSRFEDSGYLYNNLGVLYSKTDITDSTLFFLKRAQEQRNTKAPALANEMAILSIKQETTDPSISMNAGGPDDYLPLINNKLIFAALTQQKHDANAPVVFDPGMKNSTEQIIYNYNKALINPLAIDSAFKTRMESYYDTTQMAWMHDPLKVASAMVAYKKGNKAEAFEMLNHLSGRRDNSSAYYYQLLGKMALASDAPRLAANYLSEAARLGITNILPELAFSYLESGQLGKAAFMWHQILNQSDTTYHSMAEEILQMLASKGPRDMINAHANLKYLFLRYRYMEFEPALIEGLILSFDNDNYKAMAYLDIIDDAIRRGDTGTASQQIYKLQKLNINSPDILAMIREQLIHFNIAINDLTALDQLITEKEEVTGNTDALAQAYLLAYRDKHPEAGAVLEALGKQDPFDETAVLQAAAFFIGDNMDNEKAYNILLKAVNINSYSRQINEAYILQCLRVGLDNYAENALQKYKQFVPDTTYNEFLITYHRARESSALNAETW
jgi:tetratricopeptide (TPR) repeat protein